MEFFFVLLTFHSLQKYLYERCRMKVVVGQTVQPADPNLGYVVRQQQLSILGLNSC